MAFNELSYNCCYFFFFFSSLSNHLLSLYSVPEATTQQLSKKNNNSNSNGQIKQIIISQWSKHHRAQNMKWSWDKFALEVGVSGRASTLSPRETMEALGRENSLWETEDLGTGITVWLNFRVLCRKKCWVAVFCLFLFFAGSNISNLILRKGIWSLIWRISWYQASKVA